MFADIIVDISHEKLDKVFQYKIPDMLMGKLKAGMPVLIPFGKGNRVISGYVVDIKESADFEESRIKEIIDIPKKSMSIEETLINLAWFIKENYGSTMNQALKTVIPVKTEINQKINRKISLVAEEDKISQYKSVFEKKRAVGRLRFLELLSEKKEVDYDTAIKNYNISRENIKYFEENGLIKISSNVIYRNPVNIKETQAYSIVLNDEQRRISEDIKSSFDEKDISKRIHLIFGVTGSGKTEIYLDIIEETIKRGKQVIVLIPEIALTYQTVSRFYQKFGDRVSVINSKMSAGERFDQFTRARNGEIDIMIGPRSAVFTPFERLGLVVIDEEQEAAYKSEQVPKYHARETAIYRCSNCNGTVVMGSATPSIESYYKAQKGEYMLHTLEKRAKNAMLPKVHIVDLREELDKGNRGIFSEKLHELIVDRLNKKEQIMLFINRRGYGGFVSCRKCGEVMKCPHCDVGLTYHKASERLVCHYCNYEVAKPEKCPKCNSKYIAAFGTGTQKVEDLVKRQYPMAKVLRMDMDTTVRKNSHENIISTFAENEADILVGTQMIVKGHDFKNVTLVGVIAADLSLYSGDYRAGERTFQLLTQAAGRAGRDEKEGEVVIQTYAPDNYAVVSAAEQNYEEFYNNEMMYRKLMEYPPESNLMAVLLTAESKEELDGAAISIKEFFEGHKKDINRCYDNIKVLGPVDAAISKINDMYRKVVYVKSKDICNIIDVKNDLDDYINKHKDFKSISVQYDINPMNVC